MVTEESVKRMKEQRDVDGLIRVLDDSNGWVRDFAVLALGKIGDPRTIDPLSNLVNYEKLLVNMD
jgi:HEAT repeat protein